MGFTWDVWLHGRGGSGAGWYGFVVAGVVSGASAGAILALLCGFSMTRHVCWLFGLAIGFAGPEAMRVAAWILFDRDWMWLDPVNDFGLWFPFAGLAMGVVCGCFVGRVGPRAKGAIYAGVMGGIVATAAFVTWGLHVRSWVFRTEYFGLYAVSIGWNMILSAACAGACFAGERERERGFEVTVDAKSV